MKNLSKINYPTGCRTNYLKQLKLQIHFYLRKIDGSAADGGKLMRKQLIDILKRECLRCQTKILWYYKRVENHLKLLKDLLNVVHRGGRNICRALRVG